MVSAHITLPSSRTFIHFFITTYTTLHHPKAPLVCNRNILGSMREKVLFFIILAFCLQNLKYSHVNIDGWVSTLDLVYMLVPYLCIWIFLCLYGRVIRGSTFSLSFLWLQMPVNKLFLKRECQQEGFDIDNFLSTGKVVGCVWQMSEISDNICSSDRKHLALKMCAYTKRKTPVPAKS